ncbi:hypothetical protein Bbelb_128880 [Branchiostoma belcheri]|nr:hypothetical protein Bbelb_128880 [Branchiostoma belcheri]
MGECPCHYFRCFDVTFRETTLDLACRSFEAIIVTDEIPGRPRTNPPRQSGHESGVRVSEELQSEAPRKVSDRHRNVSTLGGTVDSGPAGATRPSLAPLPPPPPQKGDASPTEVFVSLAFAG